MSGTTVKDSHVVIKILSNGAIAEGIRKYWKEAISRESHLRQKYFGIHSSCTLTYDLKKPLTKIYQEELSPLQ